MPRPPDQMNLPLSPSTSAVAATAHPVRVLLRARAPEAAAGLGLFYGTAALGQRIVGGTLRITAATWLFGPAAGVAVVTASSFVAGHGAILVGNGVAVAATGKCAHVGHGNHMQNSTAFAVVGLLSFWFAGGQGKMICPSDLRFLGSFSKVGLPCTEKYAGDMMRGRVQMIGHIFGCHSCGVKHAPQPRLWVADHQPPNNIAKGMENEPFRALIAKISNGRVGGRPPQQFYPHCVECSTLQSSAVKMGRKRLVHHLSNVFTRTSPREARKAVGVFSLRDMGLRLRRWHFTGAVIGVLAPRLHAWAGGAEADDSSVLGWAELATKEIASASKKQEQAAQKAVESVVASITNGGGAAGAAPPLCGSLGWWEAVKTAAPPFVGVVGLGGIGMVALECMGGRGGG